MPGTARTVMLSLPLLLPLILAVERNPRGRTPSPHHPAGRGAAQPGFRFVSTGVEAGLTRVVLSGRPGKDHLLDSSGTGCAFLDFDRDGLLDIYIVNGWKLDGSKIIEKGRNALYRNRGNGTFEDVTDRARVAGEGQWGCGVAVADYDNDGWPDILVTNFGPNVLYRNRGDGTFENTAPVAGVEIPGWNTGAAFLDANGDGSPDLYVAGYVAQTMQDVLSAKPSLNWKGLEKVAVGPFGLPGAPDHFFLSNGKGSFVEATARSGLEDRARAFGFGVTAADFDDDGDADIYVANDSDANYLYRNEGKGTFKEVGLFSGAAFDGNGAAQAGMGVAVGDADGDGILDIFVTNFSEDFSTLYHGLGRCFFEDVSAKSGVGPPTFWPLSWGTAMADFDNDGDLDIVVANGHIYPQVDRHPQAHLTYAQPNLLLENTGQGHFVDATGRAGPGFESLRPHRGLAVGDFDNDGDLDILITCLDGPPVLLRNESSGGSWLTVNCTVPPGRGTVIGTRVELTIGTRKWVQEVSGSGSFMSAHDPRLHFGLGNARQAERLDVRWPDGSRETLRNLAVNQFLTVSKK